MNRCLRRGTPSWARGGAHWHLLPSSSWLRVQRAPWFSVKKSSVELEVQSQGGRELCRVVSMRETGRREEGERRRYGIKISEMKEGRKGRWTAPSPRALRVARQPPSDRRSGRLLGVDLLHCCCAFVLSSDPLPGSRVPAAVGTRTCCSGHAQYASSSLRAQSTTNRTRCDSYKYRMTRLIQ